MRRPARPDPRRAKKHYSYTVAEAARALGVHRNTVRSWIKAGLPHLRPRGELLIRGDDLSAFLSGRRSRRRCKSPPGSIYCMRCRAPRRPLPMTITVVKKTCITGVVRAVCTDCGSVMNRQVNLGRLAESGFGGAPVHDGGAAPRRPVRLDLHSDGPI